MNFDTVRSLVRNLLERGSLEWSVQGLGMLRTYLDPNTRLHVWHAGLCYAADAPPGVNRASEIHDHPWNFRSTIIAGELTNTRYELAGSLHSLDDRVPADLLDRPLYQRGRIVCGPNDCSGAKVEDGAHWFHTSSEHYGAGESYLMFAEDLHTTSYADGTVTIIRRTPRPDRSSEHATVYWPFGTDWMSARPRLAMSEEVELGLAAALENLRCQ